MESVTRIKIFWFLYALVVMALVVLGSMISPFFWSPLPLLILAGCLFSPKRLLGFSWVAGYGSPAVFVGVELSLSLNLGVSSWKYEAPPVLIVGMILTILAMVQEIMASKIKLKYTDLVAWDTWLAVVAIVLTLTFSITSPLYSPEHAQASLASIISVFLYPVVMHWFNRFSAR